MRCKPHRPCQIKQTNTTGHEEMGACHFCSRRVAQNYNGVPPTFLHGALESNQRDGKHIQYLEKVPRQNVEKVSITFSTRIVYTLCSLCSRCMLCESFKTVQESILRRFATDAELLSEKKNWFIDMRKHDEFKTIATIQRQHKKKLSTFMMFHKEFRKFHDQTLCPWTGAIRVADTALFVLVETVRAKAAKEARQGKPAKVHAYNCALPPRT
jgi:hypothetical protein